MMQEQSCCFAIYKPIAFEPFSFPSTSSLLKVPIVVIQKFCFHGYVMSLLSSLLKPLSFNMLMIRSKARRTGNFCKGFAAQFRYKFYYLQDLSFGEEVSPRRLITVLPLKSIMNQ